MQRILQYMVLLGCVVALAVATSAPAPSRTGYPRPSRGFKSQGLSTARGFGKRDSSLGQGTFMGSPGIVGASQPENLFPTNFDGRTSHPNSWLIEELQNNPEAARVIVEKFVDENGDGELTPEELYRRIYY